MVYSGWSRVCGSLFSVVAPALPSPSSVSDDSQVPAVLQDEFKPFSEYPDIFMKLRQLSTNSVDYVPNRLRSLFGKGLLELVDPQKEPQNLIPQHGELRPADVLIPNFRYGRDMCIDVSIVSPFLHIEQASVTPGFNANFKASQKKFKIP